MNWRIRLLRGLATAGLLTVVHAASAAATTDKTPEAPVNDGVTTPSPISDHFAVRGSYVLAKVSTDARVDATAAGLSGTPFSAERDLGLKDSSAQGRAEFLFRLRDRGRLRVGAFDLSRKGTVQLQRTLRYGDQTFNINDRVTTEFDWRGFDFTGTYSFFRSDRLELGAGLGLHVLQIDTTATVPARAVRESFDGSGPFPTVAFDGTWRMTRRFALTARVQGLDVKANSISARLVDWDAGVQFRWFPNLAVGLGYQSNYAHVDIPNEDPGGSVRFDVSGPEVFLRASF
jgi:hypothetical protein